MVKVIFDKRMHYNCQAMALFIYNLYAPFDLDIALHIYTKFYIKCTFYIYTINCLQ